MHAPFNQTATLLLGLPVSSPPPFLSALSPGEYSAHLGLRGLCGGKKQGRWRTKMQGASGITNTATPVLRWKIMGSADHVFGAPTWTVCSATDTAIFTPISWLQLVGGTSHLRRVTRIMSPDCSGPSFIKTLWVGGVSSSCPSRLAVWIIYPTPTAAPTLCGKWSNLAGC